MRQLSYFSEVLKEIMKQMAKYKYRIMILPTITGDDGYKVFFKELYVIGVIYLDEDIDRDMIHYIQAKNIKVIMLGGAAFDSRCDMVHINDMSAAYEGMKYLLEMNHKEILILADWSHSLSSGFVVDEISIQYPLLAQGEITPEEFAQALTDVAGKN